MRVDPLTVKTAISSPAAKEGARAGNPAGLFEREFHNAAERVHGERLNKLLSHIDEVSKAFKENPGIERLIEYKKLVKEFLSEVVKGYELFRRESMDYKGRRKVYIVVEKVEEKLDMMAQQFIQDNKDVIELVKMMDDIRGMLVDLYA
ncbi:YaaR family protein [Caldanaerobius polysaccharolyticus]|uniref:YaaR family protein n=1 Tax=Caldanaerobius polysaccharolyticus TaxID=44256 RepID=UPI00068FE919|nr:YaaR family protein [Caldanaerobius polysaccharolyticus]